MLDHEEVPVVHDGDALGQVLDLAQDMGPEQNRRAARGGLVDKRLELALDDGIQSARRLVEDEHLGLVHQRLDDADLLLVALGQVMDVS